MKSSLSAAIALTMLRGDIPFAAEARRFDGGPWNRPRTVMQKRRKSRPMENTAESYQRRYSHVLTEYCTEKNLARIANRRAKVAK